MKNVYQSLDHNSQLYSRTFLNQLIPMIAQVTAMKNFTSGARIYKAERMLSIDTESHVLPTSSPPQEKT